METDISATEAVAGPRSLGLPSLNPTGPSALSPGAMAG